MTSKIDIICDHSQKNLRVVPMRVLDMTNLQMLYLEGNQIEHLPGDIFQKLIKLNWLDVRNNKLKEVPAGIAHHAYLEYLLLENNEIETLPNELGLVPNLQVLQLSNNPIRYPTKGVLEKGVQSICSFLKTEHELVTGPKIVSEEISTTSETSCRQPVKKVQKRKISVRELLRKSAAPTQLKMESMPIIAIKSLSEQRKGESKSSEAASSAPVKNTKKVHKITRHCSKLNIHSHYNSNKYVGVRVLRPNEERVVDEQLKAVWLGKLKELLNDQEKILQRDKNLKALNAWRLENKPRKITGEAKIELPYDTDPEFDKMSSRKDLLAEVNKIMKKRKKHTPKNVDVQALIDDVVSQLRSLHVPMPGERSPRTEMEVAEKDIQRIIELHKRVTSLQKKNSTMP